MRSTSSVEVDQPGQHEPGVQRGERRLEPGHAHRRQLERLLLLLARVRRVVGGDAVDRARAQRPRSAPGGRPRRAAAGSSSSWCRASARPRRSAAGGAAWPRRSPRVPRRLGALDDLDGLARRHVLDVDRARPRRRRARSRGRPSSTRTPTGCRPARAAPTPRPRASRPPAESDGSSSCSASSRPASRWYWSAWRITPGRAAPAGRRR